MHSALPKVLHELGGLAVARASRSRRPRPCTRPRSGGLRPRRRGGARAICRFSAACWVHQAEQHGTGHALQLALPGVDPAALVLVLLRRRAADFACHPAGAVRLGWTRLRGTAHGRDRGAQLRACPARRPRRCELIVERQDASLAEAAVTEINTAFYSGGAAQGLAGETHARQRPGE